MTHLYIEQTESSTEEVSSGVIKKLYDMALAGLDSTSNLKGTLHTTVASSRDIAYLTGLFPNLHITADEYTITFEDAEFERICVANWGSNGVVTGNQLAAVSRLGSKWDVFKNNTSIIKATDLIYFSGLTGSNMFSMYGCTNMTEVTLPPNITQLDATFRNCTSLTTINGLDHLTSVIHNPFTDCNSLQSLVFTNLSGECSIGEINNSALTNIEINEGATSFSCILRQSGGPTTLSVPSTVRTFSFWCTNVTTITFAQNSQLTTTLGYGGFNGCRNLTTLVNFPWDTWTTMGSYCFYSCESLQGTIKTPVGQTTIEQNTFANMHAIDTIIVDSAVTSIANNFVWLRTGAKIIMNPTSPPTLTASVDGERYGAAATTGCVFYVPDASYNDYISNGGQYWTELYNNGRIKKQSELPS